MNRDQCLDVQAQEKCQVADGEDGGIIEHRSISGPAVSGAGTARLASPAFSTLTIAVRGQSAVKSLSDKRLTSKRRLRTSGAARQRRRLQGYPGRQRRHPAKPQSPQRSLAATIEMGGR